MKSQLTSLSVIVPTEAAKENIYYSLQTTVDEVPWYDILLILGDFDAKVGNTEEHHENIKGEKVWGKKFNKFFVVSVKKINWSKEEYKKIHIWAWNNRKLNWSCTHKQQMEIQDQKSSWLGRNHNNTGAKVKLKLKNKIKRNKEPTLLIQNS